MLSLNVGLGLAETGSGKIGQLLELIGYQHRHQRSGPGLTSQRTIKIYKIVDAQGQDQL